MAFSHILFMGKEIYWKNKKILFSPEKDKHGNCVQDERIHETLQYLGKTEEEQGEGEMQDGVVVASCLLAPGEMEGWRNLLKILWEEKGPQIQHRNQNLSKKSYQGMWK